MSSLADDLYRYIASSGKAAELGETANAEGFRQYGRRRISRELDALCESGRLFRSAVCGKYYYSVKNDGSGERCNPFKARTLGLSFDDTADTPDMPMYFDDDEIIMPATETVNNLVNEINLPTMDEEEDEIILPPIQPVNNSVGEINLPTLQDEEEDEIILPPIQPVDNSVGEITLPTPQDEEEDEIILPPIQPVNNSVGEITLPTLQDEEEDEDEIILPPIQPVNNSVGEITLPTPQDEEEDEDEIILPPIQPVNNSVGEITLPTLQDEEEDEDEIILPPIQPVNNSVGEITLPTMQDEEEEIILPPIQPAPKNNIDRRAAAGGGLPAHNQLYREYVQLPSQIARLKREISDSERRLAALNDERERTAAEERIAHEELDEKLAARNREEQNSANMYGNVLRMRAAEQTRIEQTLDALGSQRRDSLKELESLSVFSVMRKKELNRLIEDIDNRISAARRDMDAVHGSVEEIKKQQQGDAALQNSEKELEFARNRYEQIRTSLERKDSEIAACRNDAAQMKNELEKCVQRLEILRKEISDGRA